MNFQQLRIIREAVRHRFNLTQAANALFTSQSGVSKHIKDLEDELGVELFVRKGKRLLSLTPPGQELLIMVERLLNEAGNIKRLAEQYSQQDEGQLSIATTHTQARYALPSVVKAFKQRFPKVHLKLHQGSPEEIVQLLLSGQADIGIATEALSDVQGLTSFPYYSWNHGVVVPEGHPLAFVKPLTLEAIAQYPLITYHEGFTGRTGIDRAFAALGLTPNVVMSALDADVIKAYVELNLGVGIVAPIAFSSAKDSGLVFLDGAAMFEQNVTRIALPQGRYLRNYSYDFIALCLPELSKETLMMTLGKLNDVV
jgi:LysR family transcriptional regulator, cys regulon transcriptional activator